MEEKSWLEKAVIQFDRENFGDGDLVSHHWLECFLDIPQAKTPEESDMFSLLRFRRIEAFKSYLLTERKIALENIWRQGYRIVPPKEQGQFALETCMDKIQKGLSKGMSIAENTRLERLGHVERQRHTDIQIKIKGLNDLIQRKNKDFFKDFKLKKVLTQYP